MPEKHRLLFVSHEMTLSGAPIQLAYLVRWMQAHGWETTVIAPEPGPLATKLAGIEILYESQLLIDPAYGALRRLAPKFDAVVANTVATWEAVQAAHLEAVPVVWYIHETQVGVQLMQLIHMIEPSLGLADAIVTPTAATARIYSGFRDGIEVIPYGIPEVRAAASRRVSSRLTFAVIGTLERRKGQDVLLEAVAAMEPGMRARALFKIAGRALEAEFCEALRAKSSALENVRLVGALEHEEAMALLSDADVLVCPSRDETMPIILLEAMSLEKAIICTDVGGISEWIVDGSNGLLVAANDPVALQSAIELVLKKDGLIARLGAAARETFERHFTIDRYGEQFARIIRETIATAGSRK